MSIAKSMILFGGGGHAAVVTESARAAGYVVLGFLSDHEEPASAGADAPEIMGLKRLGAIAELPAILALHRHANFHAAIGDAALREKWLDILVNLPIPPVIHPSAVISPSAKISDGAFIGPNAVINARAIIGKGVIINSGAIIEHDCVIEQYGHIAPGSVLSGGARVGKQSLIGAGSTIIPKVKIGSNCTLGAGAVAISDVPDGATATGVPARVMDG